MTDNGYTSCFCKVCDGTGSIDIMHYFDADDSPSPFYTAYCNYIDKDAPFESGKWVRIVAQIMGIKNENDEE